jgi:hypothetical protein
MLSLLETIGDKTKLANILGHYKAHSLDKIPASAYTQIVNQLASQI